jgi:predicted PurR-regulated permease PerM
LATVIDHRYSFAIMITPVRLSYGVLALTIILAGLLHLGVPLLVILFSHFALRQLLYLTKRRWLALVLFVVVAAAIAAAAVYFTRAALLALPNVADSSIPSASAWAQRRQIELPFTDFESLRAVVIDTVKQEAHYLQNVAHFARRTTTVLVFTIIGIVAAVSLFFKTGLDPYRNTHPVKNNLYSICCGEVSKRFRDLYRSFATVMGAQITISLINTALTAIFVFAVRLPYGPLVVGITFLCGLVPIVGNLVSNTVIVFIALTVSLKLAVGVLVFLVVIHKLEYFLNSKIIGERIRNPVWLTLIALIIGERLMGIPGLILAPVVLNYVRVDMLKVEVGSAPQNL